MDHTKAEAQKQRLDHDVLFETGSMHQSVSLNYLYALTYLLYTESVYWQFPAQVP